VLKVIRFAALKGCSSTRGFNAGLKACSTLFLLHIVLDQRKSATRGLFCFFVQELLTSAFVASDVEDLCPKASVLRLTPQDAEGSPPPELPFTTRRKSRSTLSLRPHHFSNFWGQPTTQLRQPIRRGEGWYIVERAGHSSRCNLRARRSSNVC
jgi:hypothetical protein